MSGHHDKVSRHNCCVTGRVVMQSNQNGRVIEQNDCVSNQNDRVIEQNGCVIEQNGCVIEQT